MAEHFDLSTRLPPGVAERLGWYVYLYVDPRNRKPFYVGKGTGDRILAHLDDDHDSDKTRTIVELSKDGLKPSLELLAHGLKDEETALRIEAAVIDLLGLGELTNEVRGWKSLQMGRMTLDQLLGYYAAQPVDIKHPVLLIRVNKLYRHNMSEQELYEVTRGVWKLGPRREQAKYALAVFEGLVREVYHIEEWKSAGSHPYKTRNLTDNEKLGRWEFKGKPEQGQIRDLYRGHSVHKYMTPGNRNPIVYVNC